MSLLRDVVETLESAKIAHALIGAAAMTMHGVSHATGNLGRRGRSAGG